MSERLKFQGRLAEKELRARELKLKMKGLISAIRDRLDPFEDLMSIETEIAYEQSFELYRVQVECKAVMAEIEGIKKALGKV